MKDDRLRRVGIKIKEIRKSKQMSLQEVAARSDVTAGLLSKIENFRTVPSLPVLLNVAKALEVNISELVSSVMVKEEPPYFLIRKDAGILEEREDSRGLLYENLLSYDLDGSRDTHIRVNIVKLAVDVNRPPLATDAMELIHVISGTVTYGLPETEITLHEGDTLFFDGRLPHSVKNQGSVVTNLFKVYFLQTKN